MCAMAFVLGTFQSYCYFRAIEKLPTSVCVLLFFLYPLVTVILQRAIDGLRAPTITVAACVLILVGAGLTGGASLTMAGAEPRDLAFALASPLSYSFYSIVVARHARTVPVFAGAAFIQLGAMCGFAVLVLIGGLIAPPDLGGWLRVLAIGVFGTALYTIALAYSLPRLGAIGYGILSSLELVTVVVLGVALLGERLAPAQWLGVALVLSGILLYRPARGARQDRRAGSQ
jgi:drug/metabolite transporter (DMT)-like permease